MSILSNLFTDHVETEIDIAAPPSTVWAILTDFATYPEWNPFIVEAEGTQAVGQKLNVQIQLPGKKAMTFKPTVTEVESQRAFEWLGHAGLPRLFDGRHRFELISLDGDTRTRLVHSEGFAGVLVPILSRMLNTGTRAGFVAMNEAIKLQAEAAVDRTAGQRANQA